MAASEIRFPSDLPLLNFGGDQCSRELQQQLFMGGALVMRCACNRYLFEESAGHQDFLEGEYEELMKGHRNDPDRFILCENGIRVGMIRNAEVAYECSCGFSAQLEKWFSPWADIVTLLDADPGADMTVRPFDFVSDKVLRDACVDGNLMPMNDWLRANKRAAYNYLGVCNPRFLLEEIAGYSQTGTKVADHLLGWFGQRTNDVERDLFMRSRTPEIQEHALLMALSSAVALMRQKKITGLEVLAICEDIKSLAAEHGINLP